MTLILCISLKIVFLLSLPFKKHFNWFLFVYINPINFCILSLYPVKLLNALINPNSLSVDSPEFSVYIIILCPNNLSLSNDYISYHCLILLHQLRVPIVYSESSDGEHPHLVSAFNCNISNFSLLNMSLAIGFGIYSLLG